MHRFFISPENISESKVIFPNDISRQLYKVFRSKKGDYCLVFDGTGTEYLVNLNQVSSSEAFGDILEIGLDNKLNFQSKYFLKFQC